MKTSLDQNNMREYLISLSKKIAQLNGRPVPNYIDYAIAYGEIQYTLGELKRPTTADLFKPVIIDLFENHLDPVPISEPVRKINT